MSGGAFGYEHINILNIVHTIDDYIESESLGEETEKYMRELMAELRALYIKVNKLDLYLSGDTSEYK